MTTLHACTHAFASALLGLSVAGCGMITGLSNDYTFVADGGGLRDASEAVSDAASDAASDGGLRADTGELDANPTPTCSAPTSTFAEACRTCLPGDCCALAACLNDDACKRYAQCRNDCGGSQQCVRGCENRATSATRNALQESVSRCSVSPACAASCGW